MKVRALASLLIIAFAGVRDAPAQTVNWATDLSGNWANGSNWSTGAPPGPASNVTIDRGGANPVVTLSSGNITVNTLNTSEAFVLRESTFPEPFLTLNGPSRFGSTLDSLCCFLNSSSTIDIVGRWTINFLRLSGAGTTTASGGIDINVPGQFFIEADTRSSTAAPRAPWGLLGNPSDQLSQRRDVQESGRSGIRLPGQR